MSVEGALHIYDISRLRVKCGNKIALEIFYLIAKTEFNI
jgi:hypothetical protein